MASPRAARPSTTEYVAEPEEPAAPEGKKVAKTLPEFRDEGRLRACFARHASVGSEFEEHYDAVRACVVGKTTYMLDVKASNLVIKRSGKTPDGLYIALYFQTRGDEAKPFPVVAPHCTIFYDLHIDDWAVFWRAKHKCCALLTERTVTAWFLEFGRWGYMVDPACELWFLLDLLADTFGGGREDFAFHMSWTPVSG